MKKEIQLFFFTILLLLIVIMNSYQFSEDATAEPFLTAMEFAEAIVDEAWHGQIIDAWFNYKDPSQAAPRDQPLV